MVGHAVGYRSRAFVTFGPRIPLADYDPDSRRDLVSLAHRVQNELGRLYKVLPTALVAAAMQPHVTRATLTARVDDLIARLDETEANLGVRSGRQAVDEGVPLLIDRGILVSDRQRLRVRDRIVLRYYARTIQHLLAPGRRAVH